MLKRFLFFLAAGVIAFSFASCSRGNDTGSRQAITEPTSAPERIPDIPPKQEETNAGNVENETAEPAKDDYSLPFEKIRPFAVMIDNEGTRVLPQGGLDKAQIVYEVIVEGGLTRLMPVFWGTNPEMIGPVRSARHYFLDFSMEYDAIYVHYGGSPQAGADISRLKINEIDGLYLGADVFWDLTKDKRNWQDSYTSMEKLAAYAGKRKYKMTTEIKFPFTYNETNRDVVAEGGKNAKKITLKYPSMTTSYEYDSETGLYKRYRNGKPHMERVSGKQLEAKNIIILYVPNYDIKGDSEGRQEMDTTGSGKGYFITGGKAIAIKWSKESRKSQTKYTDEAGNPIVLNRGQTWIQIMPVKAKVTIE